MSDHPYTGPPAPNRPSVSLGAVSYDPVEAVQPGINTAERNYYTKRGELNAEDHLQPRFELFLLGEGEKKVTETPDTRIPSSSLFTFAKEDHTLGNMLRSRLLQSDHVTFAGYKVPHPLFSSFELRVQTDSTITPRAAVVQACRDLVSDLSTLSREFTKEWELRKLVGDGGNGNGANGQGGGNANGNGNGGGNVGR